MALLKFVFIVYVVTVLATWMVNCLPKDVCGNGQVPLAGYNCGRSSTRRNCPSTHRCVIAPNDAYAVCCPHRQEADLEVTKRSNNKPGSCTPPSGMFGICTARCTTDGDCPGDEKCCGSCPRACMKALF
jgi:hypothetical protein